MKLRASSLSAIRVVLFDIGGVLVEPSGVTTMLAWMRNTVSAEELWRMRLTSPCVRAFETGRLSPEEFADQVIADFRLPVQRDGFLEKMTRWSVTLFPGAIELIGQIPTRYVRATLCNTNVIHWKYLMGNAGLNRAFPHHFASHLIGKIKPDAEAFHSSLCLNGLAASLMRGEGFSSDIAVVGFQRSRDLERSMNDHQRPWHEDKAMRVTCYLLVALAITVSVPLSIFEILR